MRRRSPGQLASWQPGPDPTLVLLPGIFGGTEMWEPARRLLDGRHRICSLDLPALSRAHGGRLTVTTAAEALANWLAEASLARPVLVGHSLGGTVALVVAANRPDLVGGLVLVDAPAVSLRSGMARSFANVLRSTSQDPHRSWRASVGEVWRMRPHVVWHACRDILRTDASPYLADLGCAPLLIWGERDRIVPLAVAERMLDLLPTARLRVVAGAGHAPMREAPDRFVAHLLEHLDRRPQRPAPDPALPEYAAAPLARLEAGLP